MSATVQRIHQDQAFWFIDWRGAVLCPLGIKFFPMEKADAPSALTDILQHCSNSAKWVYPVSRILWRKKQIDQHFSRERF
jgi:hypothetical protein